MTRETPAAPDFEADARRTLEQERDVHLAVLGRLRDLRTGALALFQNEAARVAGKLGDEHPRSRRLAATLAPQVEIVQALEIAREIARIDVPAAGDDDALVHGRVTGENGRGISGLAVCLVDRRGQAIPRLPAATTDRSGYYALELGKGAVDGTRKFRAGVFLGVFTRDGEAVFRGTEPLELDAGARLLLHVTLRLETLEPATPPPRHGPGTPPAQDPEEPPASEKPRREPRKSPRDRVLDSLPGDPRFVKLGAGVPKLKRLLDAAEIGSAEDLAALLERPDRELRDMLKLPNLKSAALFKTLLRGAVENS